MVTKNGKEGYRSFTLVGASKTSGCNTKGHGGRFINKSARDAAKKAFTELCRTKRIVGVCTLYVTMKDTTKGGRNRGKLYVYKLQRNRLSKPMIMQEGTDREYVIEYKSSIKSVNVHVSKDCKKLGDPKLQTRGRRLKRTAKKTRMTPNNVRRMSNGKGKRVRSRYVNKNKNQNKNNSNSNSNNNNNSRPVRRSKRLTAKSM